MVKTEPMGYNGLNVLLKTYKVWLQGASPDPIAEGGWYDATNMYYITFKKNQNSEIHLVAKIFNKIFGLVV